GPSTERRPGDRHGDIAVEKCVERFDETPRLDAGGHELVVSAHAVEHLDANVVVHSRLHRPGVEELAAFYAEALLEEKLAIGRLPELARAVGFRRVLVREELADLGILRP